jgi:hypothetical protein
MSLKRPSVLKAAPKNSWGLSRIVSASKFSLRMRYKIRDFSINLRNHQSHGKKTSHVVLIGGSQGHFWPRAQSKLCKSI